MPLTAPLGFAPMCYLSNLDYIDLKNYSIKISKKEVIFLCGWWGRFLIFRGGWPGGLLTCAPMCQCFTKPICVPREVEKRQKQHVVNLKKMREKWIQQRMNDGCFVPPTYFFSIITSNMPVRCTKLMEKVTTTYNLMDGVLVTVMHIISSKCEQTDRTCLY